MKIGRGTKSTDGTGSGPRRGRAPGTSGTGAAMITATEGAEARARGFLQLLRVCYLGSDPKYVLGFDPKYVFKKFKNFNRETDEAAEKGPPGVVLQVNRNGKVGV